MAASTPGGPEVADESEMADKLNESEMAAKLSEELGDAIGFLEVQNIDCNTRRLKITFSSSARV